ncbi:MAG TPA: hypothetical protein VIV60_30740, partial [Polyangiaceae bacterium]
MADMSELAIERAKKQGQRLGIALFTIIMSAFIVVCGSQVMYQGFASSRTAVPPECKAGIAELISALRRARLAAAAEPLGERASLDRFRKALQPEWLERGGLSDVCRSDPWAIEALSAVDRLRYAEEHAVRYESVDLAPSRRQVLLIEQSLESQRSERHRN